MKSKIQYQSIKTIPMMSKKIIMLASILFCMGIQAQTDRKQPSSGPSPIVNVGKPQRFVLDNGLKVLIVENNKLPRVTFSLKIDNVPNSEGAKKGISDLTGVMIGKGTKTITKEAFNEEIDFMGVRIDFSASGASASGLSKYTNKIVDFMAKGCLDPNFTQVELDKEKALMIDGLKSEEKSVKATAARVENVLAYGKNHPYGEYLTEQSINNITLADVNQYYHTYFVPQNAYLVVVGDVKFTDIKVTIEQAFESWTKGAAPAITFPDPKNVQYTQINFVDMPNAVQSEISILNTVNLKMTDPDYFAATLASNILGGGGEARLYMNLREKHGWTYGAYSSIGSGKYVRKFKAAASVRNVVTDSSVVEFMNEIKRIRKELVTPEELKTAKAVYTGNFVMEIQKPETVASYALSTETQKLPTDFYENYIKNISVVTAEDIKRVANKYFLADNIRIVVVGKGSEVLPGLEKLKIPIMYFDKFGTPAKKTEEKKASADVSVKTVVDKYVVAIGGEKAVKAVKTTFTKASATVQGMAMEMTSKTTTDGKMKVEMTGMGMTLMKQMVNEKGGYVEQQGQRKVLEGEMLSDMKAQAHPFPELALLTKQGVTLLPIQAIDGKDAYAIKDGKVTYFFDVATGLKVATSAEINAGGQKITQNIGFGDYKEVSGVKMPFKTTMNLGFEILMTTSEIKINEGVTDADFQ
jgi:zinc protease